MKCIRCSHDSKYKERESKRCPQCKKEFAFEPKAGDKFTDAAFQSAIDAVSANGAIRWGVEHLYYEMCRKARKKSGAGCLKPGAIALLIGIVGLIAHIPPAIFPLVIGILGVIIGVVSRSRKAVSLSKDDFEKMWTRWLHVHGNPPSAIVRNPSRKSAKKAEPDLEDYSFDRAVICDRARTVDLLLANNFHFENNCAVLSMAGYPAGPFEIVRKMLKKNPRLHVYALHDASPEGCRMARQLALDPDWFKDQARVTDVGIRPGMAAPFAGLLLTATGAVRSGDGISPSEAAWLSKYSLELAAIRPEQILKRLFRSINRKEDEDESSWSSGLNIDGESFGSSADSSDGGADSFG